MNPQPPLPGESSTMKSKDGCNARMVVPPGPMDGCGVAHSHLLHSAARRLYGLHRERSSFHFSRRGLMAGAVGRGCGARSSAHDRGCVSRITTEKYSLAADWRL